MYLYTKDNYIEITRQEAANKTCTKSMYREKLKADEKTATKI